MFSAIDKAKFKDVASDHDFFRDIGTLWRCLALHVALAIQRNNQKKRNNKGHTVLVFDSHEKDQRDFAELVLDPPIWTETFYQRGKKQAPLDQIIDEPHFVDSAHVGLIQVADCFSYFLRRHLEITSGHVPPRYEGESDIVRQWFDLAISCSVSRSSIYPKRGRCGAADFFRSIAPEQLL